MIAGFANSGIKLLFPFLNRTLFLWLLGPEYLGLNGLFTSILGVLTLAELGFSMAVISSMYKPVADDDKELVCAYLHFYRTVYRCIGATIFIIGICLLPFLRKLVHGDVPPDINLYVLYLVHLVNTSLSYFLFAYRGSVLGAYARKDVLTNIQSFVSVAQYLVVFLLLLLTRSYYCYVAATVVFTVIQNVLYMVASKRLFPEIKPRGALSAERRRQVVSDVKSICLHKIGGVIAHSMDNIVISAFLGLTAIAAYGNYYYVITSVGGLVAAIYMSMLGGFGNKIHTETKEENFVLFMRACRLVGIIIIWCSAMMAALYQPFIAVWTGGNPELVRHALTPVLMVAFFYLNQSRQTLMTFKSAAALWKGDRWKPIVSGAANLIVNISLVILLPDEYKLDGVIFSTLLAFAVIEVPWETRIVFTEFFNFKQKRRYWRMHARFLVAAVAISSATWLVTWALPWGGVPGLAAKAAVALALATSLTFAVFRNDALSILRRLRKRPA